MSFKCDFLAFSGAARLFGEARPAAHQGQGHVSGRSCVSPALQQLDAVLVIEIEDELGKKSVACEVPVRRCPAAELCVPV